MGIMKAVLSFFLILAPWFAFSQTTDSIPQDRIADTIPVSPFTADTIPVSSYDSLATTATQASLRDSVSIDSSAQGKGGTVKDSVVKKNHSPRQATLRSLIVPGWGQVYNKKYWKVPIVYGAIGVPVYLFFDNRQWYNRTRYALSIVANGRAGNVDSMAAVHPQLKALVSQGLQGSLISYRNEFRKSMDYSILFTLAMWGLNVVDATVDGHLKAFDVSDDLSLEIKPSSLAGPGVPGLALVINFK